MSSARIEKVEEKASIEIEQLLIQKENDNKFEIDSFGRVQYQSVVTVKKY